MCTQSCWAKCEAKGSWKPEKLCRQKEEFRAFFAASFHVQKASLLPGAMSPSPAPSELEVRVRKRSWGEALSTSREQSSSSWPCLPGHPGQHLLLLQICTGPVFFFISTSLLPLPPCACGWYLQVSCLWLAKVGCPCLHNGGASQETSRLVTPQNGSGVFYSGQASRDQTQAWNTRGVCEPGKKEIQ